MTTTVQIITPSGVKTRVCIISDTHTHVPLPPNVTATPYRQPFPASDVFLHAGDLTMVGREDEHVKMLNMFKNVNAELKIIIAGNHDITLDEEYYNFFGYRRHTTRADLRKIRDLYCGEEARKHGIVYLEEGLRTFKLKNGAQFTLYASPYQPAFCNWAFAYKRSHDRFNPPAPAVDDDDARRPAWDFQAPNPIPSFPAVDIMLTHGPPQGVLDETNRDERVGCVHLRRAVARVRPRLHCFGHIHEGYGAQRMDWSNKALARPVLQDRETELRDRCTYVDVSRGSESPLRFGEETLFVNAAVVTRRYEPLNAPWVVDIDLPPCSTDGEDGVL
ncbi:hypothetical protein AJ80_03774 [Polytolypa hystricis UAMH7299]|uniref:Calcineurin-like phosphoesterase domain-containing protein n=1 Tax=Polytolypa hystricis (strain UAMH7299) TaxID=1447883 RepID=A0A2B7YGX2_POLH7|nr:hypothetical protein AJ80_03774 [Polytolypa hystricis UAMH7299]